MMGFTWMVLIRVTSIALLFVCLVNAQDGTLVFNTCSSDSSPVNGSRYGANVRSALSLLSSNNVTSYDGFSVGSNADQVNVAALCRGDISQSDCQSCLNFSISDLLARCPDRREAIFWYDSCMLRYSNESIFGILDPIYRTSFNPNSVEPPDQFNRALSTLLSSLRDHASLGNSTRKFAVGYTNYTTFGRIYALAQCTPELSGELCGKCLDWAFRQLSDVSAWLGGRVYCGSCDLRYEISQFYRNISEALLVPQAPTSRPTLVPKTVIGNSIQYAILAVASTIGFLILITVIVIFVMARLRRAELGNAGEIGGTKPLQFDLGTVKTATDNFSIENKLGQGGFGAVFKGKLVNEQLVAVKRLALSSGQGDLEFKNEVLLLTKLQHKNLVRLLGFCLEGQERLLIYEFVPNASLDQFLFDKIKRMLLDWEKRFKIIGGIARGLLYLHEDSRHRIIHRDLKASNILLDEDMIPKIADFGLARLFPEDQTRGETSKVVGTYGYMAPEYGRHGHFSVKSDVYSFGVLVLELVSGRKNTHVIIGETEEDLVSFVWESWRSGTTADIIDPVLEDAPRNEIIRCIHLGLLCVQERVSARPSMSSVVAMLNGYSISLPVPLVPAFHGEDASKSRMALLLEQSWGTDNSDRQDTHIGQISENGISDSGMDPR